MSTARSFAFAAPLALAAALFTGLAQAQSTCAADADCPRGYECQVTGGTACATPDCAAGEECPPSTCEPQEFSDCVAIPNGCSTDADCAAGMACYTHTYETCDAQAASPCAPNEECPEPAPEPVTCETVTESSCVPRYMLPCQAAADCGAGFECKPVEMCQCSGSAGGSGGSSPPSDGAGGAPDEPAPEPLPPEEPSCTCELGDTSYCAIVEVVCATNAECPTDWSCGDNPESVVCSGPSGDGEGAECGSTEPDKVCLPPYADTVIGIGRDGGPVYASDEDASDQAGLGEATPASAPSSGESSETSASGGCSVAGGASPVAGAGAWLSLLGLSALLRRRRR